VACFYFDVREDGEFSPDDEGLECRDLDAAERIAAETAASITRDKLPKGGSREVSVEVRDETGQSLLTVTVAMRTERTQPVMAN
jgi:hypothetical protein